MNEQNAYNFFKVIFWGKETICPECKGNNLKEVDRKIYCNSCRRNYTIRHKTFMKGRRISYLSYLKFMIFLVDTVDNFPNLEKRINFSKDCSKIGISRQALFNILKYHLTDISNFLYGDLIRDESFKKVIDQLKKYKTRHFTKNVCVG